MEIILHHPHKTDIFCALFQNIKQFTDHINLFFEKERLFVQSMDSAHVSILEIELPAKWFDSYKAKESEGSAEANWPSIVIGLNVSVLSKILATREKSQTITIVYNPEQEDDKLFIHFVSENRSIFDKHFELPLVDIDSQVMEIPAIDYQAEMTISAANFANIINQLKLFGDTMEIHCSEEKIVMYSNSPESGKMFVEVNMDDLTEFAIEEGGKMEVSFSLTYLHKIAMYHKLVKDIQLKISANYPMKIVYGLETVEEESQTDFARMTFYLAPKMNEDG